MQQFEPEIDLSDYMRVIRGRKGMIITFQRFFISKFQIKGSFSHTQPAGN